MNFETCQKKCEKCFELAIKIFRSIHIFPPTLFVFTDTAGSATGFANPIWQRLVLTSVAFTHSTSASHCDKSQNNLHMVKNRIDCHPNIMFMRWQFETTTPRIRTQITGANSFHVNRDVPVKDGTRIWPSRISHLYFSSKSCRCLMCNKILFFASILFLKR